MESWIDRKLLEVKVKLKKIKKKMATLGHHNLAF
jgi:hypothetical protein